MLIADYFDNFFSAFDVFAFTLSKRNTTRKRLIQAM